MYIFVTTAEEVNSDETLLHSRRDIVSIFFFFEKVSRSEHVRLLSVDEIVLVHCLQVVLRAINALCNSYLYVFYDSLLNRYIEIIEQIQLKTIRFFSVFLVFDDVAIQILTFVFHLIMISFKF